MTNINIELFKRYKPENKIKMIEALSENELWAVTPETITRIIKEAGLNKYKSRAKILRISNRLQEGNHWNSSFESVETYKKKLYVNLYVQYGDCDTDTTREEEYSKFFRRCEYRGEIHGTDRYDNPKTYYYFYDDSDKAKCLKSILLQYVHSKYADKLNPKAEKK